MPLGKAEENKSQSSTSSFTSTSTELSPIKSAPESSEPPAVKISNINWKVVRELGAGSFGTVYLALNQNSGSFLAVKTINLKTKHMEQQALEFEKETLIMERIRHPNVVSIYGIQYEVKKMHILMEYVAGNSLDHFLKCVGPLSESVIRFAACALNFNCPNCHPLSERYTQQLVSALAFCHSRNVIHRDVKGQNILVDSSGAVKLADFGSAKHFLEAESNFAPSISYHYTPLWTAPEVIVGDYNCKVDIWSLGCVLVEMATAQLPFVEHGFKNTFQALYQIGHKNITPIIPTTLSEDAQDFMRCCLTRDPKQRWTAQELLTHPFLVNELETSESDKHFLSGPNFEIAEASLKTMVETKRAEIAAITTQTSSQLDEAETLRLSMSDLEKTVPKRSEEAQGAGGGGEYEDEEDERIKMENRAAEKKQRKKDLIAALEQNTAKLLEELAAIDAELNSDDLTVTTTNNNTPTNESTLTETQCELLLQNGGEALLS